MTTRAFLAITYVISFILLATDGQLRAYLLFIAIFCATVFLFLRLTEQRR